jgi:hypothetical protein
MSDEFDSPDPSKKAGVEGTLNNAKRPSDDVVQRAPVKCYEKRHLRKHRRLLPLQAGAARVSVLRVTNVSWLRTFLLVV